MDFLVAAWSFPNGRIRKFLLLLAIPVALLAYLLRGCVTNPLSLWERVGVRESPCSRRNCRCP